MSTRVDLETFLDDRIDSWVDIPCHLARDNEPARSADKNEWMRLTVQEGFSFLNETAGSLDPRSTTVAHPFVLVFDIYTPLNKGTLRSAQIAQAVSDYWAFNSEGNIKLDAASFERVSEDSNTYHTSVSIDAARYEQRTR